MYIYQHSNWTQFSWNNEQLLKPLGEVRYLQGKILGRMLSLGFDIRNEAGLNTLTIDVLKSSEIEGEILNPQQVRSSLARRLGVAIVGSVDSDRTVDGMVDMMLDATVNYNEPLSFDRLFAWHAALFTSGRSGKQKITVGAWRNDSKGPMQVVSGVMGKEKVHFQAPPASTITSEMTKFVDWFNSEELNDLVLKAAIAHLWFITIHPFEDGNGRIARALSDLMLARSDNNPQRFYSLSSQIRIERKQYYEILEQTQKSGTDISNWLIWFLNCLMNALKTTDTILDNVFYRAHFWNMHSSKTYNNRQLKIINLLLEGFEGKLTSSKWAKIGKCSSDTALRDIQDLISKGILSQGKSGGRSTFYELVGDEKV
jgi:Fic family protein